MYFFKEISFLAMYQAFDILLSPSLGNNYELGSFTFSLQRLDRGILLISNLLMYLFFPPLGQARNSAHELVKKLNVQVVKEAEQHEGEGDQEVGPGDTENKKSVEVIIVIKRTLQYSLNGCTHRRVITIALRTQVIISA